MRINKNISLFGHIFDNKDLHIINFGKDYKRKNTLPNSTEVRMNSQLHNLTAPMKHQ